MKQENIVKDKSYQFSLNILNLVKKFPKNTEGFVIGNQILKSGTSIIIKTSQNKN